MDQPEVKPQIGLLLNPDGCAVDAEGNVVIAIEKIWPSADFVARPHGLRTGYSALPYGLMLVQLPVKVEDLGGTLTFEEFGRFLSLAVEALEPQLRGFVRIVTPRPAEEDF